MLQEGSTLQLVFVAGALPLDDDDENVRMLSVALARRSADQITAVEIRVNPPRKSSPSYTSSTPGRLENYWKPLLRSIASSFPRMVDLEISCVFDSTGQHAMRITDLTDTLQAARRLKSIKLHSMGLLVDDSCQQRLILGDNRVVHRDCFGRLEAAVAAHGHLQNFQLTAAYFLQKRRVDSWLFYSLLVQAVVRGSANLRHFTLTTAPGYYSRPILTLLALTSLLAHRSLQYIHLEHLNLWGGGSAAHVARSLRRTTALKILKLRACVFGTTPDQDDDTRSMLQGLDTNSSIEHLDLTASSLHLEVPGLVRGLKDNKNLQSLVLSQVQFGYDQATHGREVCHLLKSLHGHCSLTSLELHSIWLDDSSMANTALSMRAMCGAQAVIKSVLELVRTNRFLMNVKLDQVCGGNQTAEELLCSDQLAEIRLLVSLNRAEYWDLCSVTNRAKDWTQSMSRVIEWTEYDDCDAVPALFHMLSSNPLLCQL